MGRFAGAPREAFGAVLRIGREEIVEAAWVDNGPGWIAVMLAFS